MSMAPKDWKEQEKAVTAAKAEILAALKKTDGKLDLGLRTVKSIQRGIVHFGGNNNSRAEIKISEVNPDKCIVLVDVVSYSSGSYVYSTNFSSLTETKLTITSGLSGYTSVNICWQVIEFF